MLGEATQIVAIDGPVGAGKSSVGRKVAHDLGFHFLDTGAMYRAATWWAVNQGIDLDDPSALAAATGAMDLDLSENEGAQVVTVAGQDITQAIRKPEITRQIYRLDRVPEVRTQLVKLQQEFGARQPTVAEGRDIGTVVFPKAKCKIYLDASVESRVQRRLDELKAKGVEMDAETLRRDIEERDHKSMTRATSPLRKAEDAILLDSTSLSFDGVIDAIVALARKSL